MNYIQKNKTNLIIMVAGVFILTALVIWAFKDNNHTADDIMASVYPVSLKIGEPLTFKDESPFTETRHWFFSDGFETTKKEGTHVFEKPGYYQLNLIINDNLTKSFSILVSPANAQISESTVINAPKKAMQYENILFRAEAPNAEMFTWKFGETGNIDATERVTTYAYKKPGEYTILLYTDVEEKPRKHQIEILPAFTTIQDKLDPLGRYSKIGNDFKRHLQKIADGDNFNYHYNYLVQKYLCGEDNIPMVINDKKTSFYYYCTRLQFDKNNFIQDVKITLDSGQNCVTKVVVKQTKQ